MLKIEHEENQAEKLQQLFAEVTNQPNNNKNREEDKEENANLIEVDVLNLPPRSEVHQQPKRKLYIRFKSPLTRLLIILLLLFVTIGIIYYIAGEQIIMLLN